jgi:hypothetical protein
VLSELEPEPRGLARAAVQEDLMRTGHSVAAALMAVFALVTAGEVWAQTVTPAVKQDVSPALSSLPPAPARAEAAFKRLHRVKRLPPLPPSAQAAAADTSRQTSATTPMPIGPIEVMEGIGEGLTGYNVTSFPADTTGAAGTTQYVQWVNTSLAIFDKATKKAVLGPVDGSMLWRGFGGNCEHFNDGDPIVLFDHMANRWVMSQFAVSGTPFSQCIAVSTTPDATGTYNRYEFQYPDFNDYGKFGIWPDGYYASFNMFGTTSFLGSKVCAYERPKMVTGEAARMICFDLPGQGGLVPADVDGAATPPEGAANYVMNIGTNRLNLWRFHADWANPSAATLTGPVSITTAPFKGACETSATPGTCIVQPSTTQRLDSLGDRLMYRLAYRKLADHESLVATHSVAITTSRAALRWYEVRGLGGTPQVQQQGTYMPTSSSRWMGSGAMDKMGNIAVGYSISGASVFPSIRIAGRLASDPAGKLSAEKTIAEATGQGAQTQADRWGDYSTMSVDPTDDCTFWYSAQYQKDGIKDWHTAIVRFKFNACQ